MRARRVPRLVAVVLLMLSPFGLGIAGPNTWTQAGGASGLIVCSGSASLSALRACIDTYYDGNVSDGTAAPYAWSFDSMVGPTLSSGANYNLTIMMKVDVGSFTSGSAWVLTLGACSGENTWVWESGCTPPDDDDCEAYSGPSGYWMIGGPGMPSNECHGPSRCQSLKASETCSAGECVAYYTIGGSGERQGCAASAEGGTPDVVPGDGEACAGEFCQTTENDFNCGFIDGGYVCLGKVENDGCVATPGGGRVCGGDAPVPPRPDNGSPGVPAPPDETIVINEGDTFNFFNGTTVGGSHNPVNSGGDNPNDGEDDGSGLEGNGSGTGTGDGAGNCDPSADETCSAEGVGSPPDMSGMPCYASGGGMLAAAQACTTTAFNTAWTSMQSAPVFAFAGDLGSAFASTGECPHAEFSMWGESLDYGDSMCLIAEQNMTLIQILFLIGWSLLGLRIILDV